MGLLAQLLDNSVVSELAVQRPGGNYMCARTINTVLSWATVAPTDITFLVVADGVDNFSIGYVTPST